MALPLFSTLLTLIHSFVRTHGPCELLRPVTLLHFFLCSASLTVSVQPFLCFCWQLAAKDIPFREVSSYEWLLFTPVVRPCLF